ncbi:unnamed protein product, partial [Staurois parvus]
AKSLHRAGKLLEVTAHHYCSLVARGYCTSFTHCLHSILQEMVRDCRYTTGEYQRLQTYYRRGSETADILQESIRDCRHTTGDDQRLQTYYRRGSKTADI